MFVCFVIFNHQESLPRWTYIFEWPCETKCKFQIGMRTHWCEQGLFRYTTHTGTRQGPLERFGIQVKSKASAAKFLLFIFYLARQPRCDYTCHAPAGNSRKVHGPHLWHFLINMDREWDFKISNLETRRAYMSLTEWPVLWRATPFFYQRPESNILRLAPPNDLF